MDALSDPQYKTKDGSALRIWRDSAKNGFLSEREGRPVFDDVILAEVISPGSRDSTPVFELKRKFADQMGRTEPKLGPKYEELKEFVVDFEKGEEAEKSMTGTPLSQWPELTRSMVATLRAGNVFTVDALASLPDTKLGLVGPDGRTWREKAKAYLENAKNGAYATELAAENDRLKADLAAQAEQVKTLAQQVEALQAQASGTAPVAVQPAPEPTDPTVAATPAKGAKSTPPII
jgi:hypothetical protein